MLYINLLVIIDQKQLNLPGVQVTEITNDEKMKVM